MGLPEGGHLGFSKWRPLKPIYVYISASKPLIVAFLVAKYMFLRARNSIMERAILSDEA